MRNLLQRLRTCFSGRCGGDLECQYGVKMGALDNLGWVVQVDRRDANLEGRQLARTEHKISKRNWMCCEVSNVPFQVRVSPSIHFEIHPTLLDWTEQADNLNRFRENGVRANVRVNAVECCGSGIRRHC